MASGVPAKKVLVVDDDPVILKTLSSALEASGYMALTAVDAAGAFAMVRRSKPDLILLDIFFPPDIFQSGNSWDAFLIIQWLQRMGESRGRQPPVIIISVAEPEEFKARCLAAGVVGYFQKPIKVPELLDAIREALRPRVSDIPVEVAADSNAERLRRANNWR